MTGGRALGLGLGPQADTSGDSRQEARWGLATNRKPTEGRRGRRGLRGLRVRALLRDEGPACGRRHGGRSTSARARAGARGPEPWVWSILMFSSVSARRQRCTLPALQQGVRRPIQGIAGWLGSPGLRNRQRCESLGMPDQQKLQEIRAALWLVAGGGGFDGGAPRDLSQPTAISTALPLFMAHLHQRASLTSTDSNRPCPGSALPSDSEPFAVHRLLHQLMASRLPRLWFQCRRVSACRTRQRRHKYKRVEATQSGSS